MELRTYWQILLRRWWLALIPAIVVLGIGLATYRQPAPVYQVGIRFTVGYTPETSATSLYDKYYSAWLASEYIAAGLGEWVQDGRLCRRGEPRAAKTKRGHLGGGAGRTRRRRQQTQHDHHVHHLARRSPTRSDCDGRHHRHANAQCAGIPATGTEWGHRARGGPASGGTSAAGAARSTRPADSRGAGVGSWALRLSFSRTTFHLPKAAPEFCGRMSNVFRAAYSVYVIRSTHTQGRLLWNCSDYFRILRTARLDHRRGGGCRRGQRIWLQQTATPDLQILDAGDGVACSQRLGPGRDDQATFCAPT